MPDDPQKNPLYSAYDRQTSPSKADREAAAMDKAQERGRPDRSGGNPDAKIAAMERRIGVLEAKLLKAHGKNGVTVHWPIISGSGKAGAGLDLSDLPIKTVNVQVFGELFEFDLVVIAVRALPVG